MDRTTETQRVLRGVEGVGLVSEHAPAQGVHPVVVAGKEVFEGSAVAAACRGEDVGMIGRRGRGVVVDSERLNGSRRAEGQTDVMRWMSRMPSDRPQPGHGLVGHGTVGREHHESGVRRCVDGPTAIDDMETSASPSTTPTTPIMPGRSSLRTTSMCSDGGTSTT